MFTKLIDSNCKFTWKITNKLNTNFNFDKLLFLLSFQFILLVLMILFVYMGFNSKYAYLKVQEISQTIAFYRSFSIFLICWFATISMFIIIKTKNIKSILGYKSFFYYLSFIPVFWIFDLFFCFKNTSWINLKIYIKYALSSDNELSLYYSRWDWKYWIMILLWIIMCPIIVISFYQKNDYVTVYPENGIGNEYKYTNLWFVSLGFFTLQTNLLCMLFVTLFLINPRLKIFKANTFLIGCVVYIFIVGVTYDFALFPVNVLDGKTANWDWYKWYCNIYEHLINPIAFVTCGLILLCQKKELKPMNYKSTMLYTMIIPTIYLTYVIVNPFITNFSVYGFLTNLNPNVYNGLINGENQSTGLIHGEPYLILVIVAYWLIFYGLISGLYAIQKHKFIDFRKILKGNNINENKYYC